VPERLALSRRGARVAHVSLVQVLLARVKVQVVRLLVMRWEEVVVLYLSLQTSPPTLAPMARPAARSGASGA